MLTPDEWDAGTEDVALALRYILKERWPLALSLQELRIELGNLDRFPSVDEMLQGLERLVQRRRAQAKNFDGTMYYRTVQRLGFRPRED